MAHVTALRKVVLDKQCKQQVMMFLLTVHLVCFCSLCTLSVSQDKRQARVEAESARREAEEAERSRAEELKRQETERVQSEQASERRYATVLEFLYAPQAPHTKSYAQTVFVDASAHLDNRAQESSAPAQLVPLQSSQAGAQPLQQRKAGTITQAAASNALSLQSMECKAQPSRGKCVGAGKFRRLWRRHRRRLLRRLLPPALHLQS